MAEIKLEKTGKYAFCKIWWEVEGVGMSRYGVNKLYEGSKARCIAYAEKKVLTGNEYVIIENFDGNSKTFDKKTYTHLLKPSLVQF